MQDATQVARLHQCGQRALDRRFNLPHIFAQLWFDIGHAQGGVDVRFILARDQLQVWILAFEEPIVINGHIHAKGTSTQGDVVFARTREVVERIGKLAVLDHAQVHGDTAAQDDA